MTERIIFFLSAGCSSPHVIPQLRPVNNNKHHKVVLQQLFVEPFPWSWMSLCTPGQNPAVLTHASSITLSLFAPLSIHVSSAIEAAARTDLNTHQKPCRAQTRRTDVSSGRSRRASFEAAARSLRRTCAMLTVICDSYCVETLITLVRLKYRRTQKHGGWLCNRSILSF